MGRVAEAAYDAALLDDQPDSDAVILRVAERLSILGFDQQSCELAQLAAELRSLVAAPTCRWCGKVVNARKSYWGLGAVFCSSGCRDEALTPEPPEVSRD